VDHWVHHTGALGVERFTRSRILDAIRSAEFDLVWVDSGNLISSGLVRELKRRSRFVVITTSMTRTAVVTGKSGVCTWTPPLVTTWSLSFVTATSPKHSKRAQETCCACTGRQTKWRTLREASQLLPQPPLPEVSNRSPGTLDRRTLARTSPGALRPCGLHDATEVSRVGIPTVMMFVQSLNGISHNKIEDT
jgi:hypothetical protein